MFRTRIVWTFLGSLTLLVGGAAAADEPPAKGETGGQTYGGATYDKAGEASPQQQTSPTINTTINNEPSTTTTPAPTQPVVEHKTTVVTPAPIMTVEPVIEKQETRLLTPFGLSLAVGGGVTNFTDESMDDLTKMGGAWDARLTIGSRMPIAFEAAYIGSAQEISALGLDPSASLVSNGVEGDLRLNLGNYRVQPFIFGGGAWQRYDLVGENFNLSSVRSRDDVFALPVGAGVAAKYRGFLVDVRGTYREVWDNDLVSNGLADSNDKTVELNNWAASARVGFEF